MKFTCLTHQVSVTVDGNKKVFETPPGSLRGIPQCVLMTAKEPQEGNFGPCVIRKEGS